MQVFYWWFDTRERLAARAARQREEEDQRVTQRAALREGDSEAGVEARLGAVVPPAELPAEPALAELPADPRAQGDCVAFDRARCPQRIPARAPE